MKKNNNNQRELLSQNEMQALRVKKGNVRGLVCLANFEYIRYRGGEEAVEKIEAGLKRLSYPFEEKNINPMDFYPEALSVLIILLAQRELKFDEEEIFKMGRAAIKLTPFIKILTKYFVSIKKCFQEAPKYWQKFFDFGKLEAISLNEKERQATIRVLDYDFHPIMCIYHKGYFTQVAQFALGKKGTIKIEETKCIHKGDSCHEYRLFWD